MRKPIAATHIPILICTALMLMFAADAHAATGLTAAAGAPPRVTFLQLGTPLNGNMRYCTNCAATSPCTGGGTGAFAYRVGNAWSCNTGAVASSSTGDFTVGQNLLFAANGSISTSGTVWTISDNTNGTSFIFDLNSLSISPPTLTIPATGGTIVTDVATQTLTNKTMDATLFNGAITPSQTAGIVGTTTNNNANAGSVGEFVTATANPNTASLSSGISANTTASLSLGAGDWDCWGVVNFTFGATTSITNLAGGISTTTGTLPAQDSYFDYETSAMVPTGAAVATWVVPTVRLSNSGSTNVFLVAQATFSVSTIKVGGTIRCRRMR